MRLRSFSTQQENKEHSGKIIQASVSEEKHVKLKCLPQQSEKVEY